MYIPKQSPKHRLHIQNLWAGALYRILNYSTSTGWTPRSQQLLHASARTSCMRRAAQSAATWRCMPCHEWPQDILMGWLILKEGVNQQSHLDIIQWSMVCIYIYICECVIDYILYMYIYVCMYVCICICARVCGLHGCTLCMVSPKPTHILSMWMWASATRFLCMTWSAWENPPATPPGKISACGRRVGRFAWARMTQTGRCWTCLQNVPPEMMPACD